MIKMVNVYIMIACFLTLLAARVVSMPSPNPEINLRGGLLSGGNARNRKAHSHRHAVSPRGRNSRSPSTSSFTPSPASSPKTPKSSSTSLNSSLSPTSERLPPTPPLSRNLFKNLFPARSTFHPANDPAPPYSTPPKIEGDDTKPLKVLFLSADTGGGHRAR